MACKEKNYRLYFVQETDFYVEKVALLMRFWTHKHQNTLPKKFLKETKLFYLILLIRQKGPLTIFQHTKKALGLSKVS
jgi:hypothetical protein